MGDLLFQKAEGVDAKSVEALRKLLDQMKAPFKAGDRVGIKLHWGERGNISFLPPALAREIVRWLTEKKTKPFIFDTTVLYSGGRRNAADSLETARQNGYSESFLGCPVVIADGMDGRKVVDLKTDYKHFKTVQVADVFSEADGFFIFSHFKGHLASGFGGAIKNLSMGFASRAQKQRMHADVRPILDTELCTRCGVCVEVCPTGAACMDDDAFPTYDLDLCIGCAQCIAQCPTVALEIIWETDMNVFQEKLVETAAAVWEKIEKKSVLVNAVLNITADCDCLPGKNPRIAPDAGYVGGCHPVEVDAESVKIVGRDVFSKTHPGIPWQRQFSYAEELGF